MGLNHWDDIFKRLQLGDEVVVSNYSRETIRTTIAKRISGYKRDLGKLGTPIPRITLIINRLGNEEPPRFSVRITENAVHDIQ